MRPVLYVLPIALMGLPLSAQQQPAPCSTSEYRQFDFWAGSWNVFNPKGQQVGTNTIEPILGGCALRESWVGSGQGRGFSFNMYDRTTGRWHQTWVGNGGLLLLLDGGLAEDRMVLEGTTANAQGGKTLHRITWTPVAADSVRQLWETSADEGKTWSVAFDGLYVRR